MLDPAPKDAIDEDLFTLLYPELRRLARAKLRKLPAGSPLQPTALVHEVYLRLHERAKQTGMWRSREHFLAVAARVMWFVLVDHIRRETALQRGGGLLRVTLTDANAPRTVQSDFVLDLDRALARLRQEYPDIADMVILRTVAGLTATELAKIRSVSPRTIGREWRFARTWLYKELAK